MMKIKFLVLLIVSFSYAFGQTKFDKGSVLGYEYLLVRKNKGAKFDGSSTRYLRLDITVMEKNSDGLLLTVTVPRSIINVPSLGTFDTDDSLKYSPLPFVVPYQVLKNIPIYLQVDHSGNIIKVEDRDGLKKTILAEQYKYIDKKERERYDRYADNIIKSHEIISICKEILKPTNSIYKKQKLDSILTSEYSSTSSRGDDGLVTHLNIDSSVYENSLVIFAENRIINRIGKVDAKFNLQGVAYSELYPYGKTINDPSAIWKLQELQQKYFADKSANLVNSYKKTIDAMDKIASPIDYDYWSKRLELSQYIGDDFDKLISKVPGNYIADENLLVEKLRFCFETLDFEEFLLVLGKLYPKDDAVYKMQIFSEDLDEFVNGEMAKSILNSKNPRVEFFFMKLKSELHKPINITKRKPFASLFNYLELIKSNPSDSVVKFLSFTPRDFSAYTPRYRLMIFDYIKKNMFPDSIYSAYLDTILSDIQRNSSSYDELAIGKTPESLFWKTYLPKLKTLSEIYLFQAYYRKSKIDTQNNEVYQNLANKYAPSRDNAFLELVNKENEFLSDLNTREDLKDLKISDPQKYLSALAYLCIIEPEGYESLSAEFTKINPSGSFKDFFSSQLKNFLPRAEFKLNGYSEGVFESEKYRGKFVFIDFWGTWCAACLEESHEINAYHQKSLKNNNLMVVTIACFDKKENVQGYMSRNSFSFPVLMSDGNIEDKFGIQVYPTKILVLPNGHYIKLPVNTNFAETVSKYMKWNINTD